MQSRRMDAFAERQIQRQFVKPLLELTTCTRRVVALAMIETGREVNEGLQEQPARPGLDRPTLFQRFVALEKFTIVEELDSPLQWLVHD